ncbi:aminotransferase class V-fold PLP-dependent enzyme [Streptomyces sp. UH6]|uniref:aminotransferase class V-fold PLP-dependent enzyme n=1 Tax=Streptomyces sp. UH6 TaxID=2748379 RepID=UPI0015D496A9|nr:aminotransferase class V-fold PLP-dependent enzyme [Streptomyces sp. UH6]NYV75418.1 aminotransferase class V-fold PLP-dependent enzyme [Streptomyces sp. UH6]
MPNLDDAAASEFRPGNLFLNTAAVGLLPARSTAAVRAALEDAATGRPADIFGPVEQARASYARLMGVSPGRVAVGTSVAAYSGLIAASLPAGAEVLTAEGDFSSLVNPFHVRGDLSVRAVALEKIPEAIGPGTAMVVVSAVQSADGRLVDLPALRAAAAAHGARICLDVSQAAGWLPLDAGEYDFTVTVTHKWLCSLFGLAFLTVPEDFGGLRPLSAGWVAGEEPWASCYGPIGELARSARRFDEPQSMAPVAAARSLALFEELGVEAVHRHDLALADRFREGLARLGHEPLPSPGSPIVSVPGLGGRQPGLSAAGIELSDRAGSLRAAFHLYNSPADVDRLLDVLAR